MLSGLIWLGASLLVACHPPPVVIIDPTETDNGQTLFSEAVQLDNMADYDHAMKQYRQYLIKFPDGPQADTVLFRIGKIYQKRLQHTDARNAYRRLVRGYPNSRHLKDATVEILTTLFEEAKYQDLLAEAPGMLKTIVSKSRKVRINRLLGDTYSAMGKLAKAAVYYKRAYGIADVSVRASLLERFQEILAQLDTPSLTILLEDTTEKRLHGFIQFQLAQNLIDSQKTETAEKRLEQLLEQSPDHEKAAAATQMLAQIRQKAAYDPNAIGCMLPLTGPYKAYGSRALKGIELALRQFGAETGIVSIRLVISDTASDPIKTVTAVQYMAEQKVAAIIGPMITAQEAAVEAQEREIPLIALSQKDNITSAGDFIFRNFITPKLQVNALVTFAVEGLDATRFAILYPDDRYGKAFMGLFWDEVIAAKRKVVGVESYPSAHTDFADPIKKLTGLFYKIPKALNIQRGLSGGDHKEDQAENAVQNTPQEGEPAGGVTGNPESIQTQNPPEDDTGRAVVDFDVVFIPDAPKTAGLIIPQLAFHDVKHAHLLGTNLWHSPKLIQMARQYVQNAVFSSGFNVDGASKKVKTFVMAFLETFGERPGFIEAIAFDTATLLLEQMTRPDVQHRSRLKEALLAINGFDGLTGPTSFDPSGEARKSLFLFRIEKDRFVEIQKKR